MRETRVEILDGASVALCRRDGRQVSHKQKRLNRCQSSRVNFAKLFASTRRV
jgi:hypothetical protein